MKKIYLLFISILFIACSADDDIASETFFNPHDLNSAKIDFNGYQMPNDSIPSVFVSTSFCCEDKISINLSTSQPEFRGHILSLQLSSEGEILKYHTQNDFLDTSIDLHFSPYFYIPEDFYEIEQFDFNFDEERLDLKGKFKLLKEGTYLEDNEVIDVDAEVKVRYFTPCSCGIGSQIRRMRQVELMPDIKFTNFTKGRVGFESYFYRSTDVSTGFYFKLENLTSGINNYTLGVYPIGDDESTPHLIFKKFIGPPQVFLSNYFLEDEWVNYETQGQFEIIEKLDNNLTRSKLTFTASLNGEVIYEFTDVEMIL